MISDLLPSAALNGLTWFASRAEAYLALTLRDYAKLGLVLAVTIILEIAARKNWRVRYGSRNFRVDLLYFVFYYGGFYHLFLFTWMYKALHGLVVDNAP